MGRRDTHTDGDREGAIKLIVHHLPFVDGDYDAGGAYWGAGEPLWRAVEVEGDVEFFLRAKDRWEALEAVREEYPAVEIVETPRELWFEDFVQGYETAALWSSTDTITNEDGEEEDVNLDDGYEVAEQTKAEFREDCKDFVDFAEPQLVAAMAVNGYTAERAGHDFWLTRAGHGAGFWDRNELPQEIRDSLTQASKSAGSRDLYIGDDELVYQS
jgi:hypothetical protein